MGSFLKRLENEGYVMSDLELEKEAEDYMTKVSSERKVSEVGLFNKWKKTSDPKYFQELYRSMKPMLYDATKNASFNSNIPQSAHMAYAAQSFMDSLRTYEPSKGALQTHVYGNVKKKANRLNYLYQDLGHKPEPRAIMVGTYQAEKQYLKDLLGREPSAAEIADRMGVPVSEIKNLEREVTKDLALDEITEQHAYFMKDKEEEKLDFLYYDLAGEQQVVYDYILGAHGKPKLVKANGTIDFDRIASLMGVSASKVRTIHKKLGTKLERMR